MKKFTGTFVLISFCIGLAFVHSRALSATTPDSAIGVSQSIKELEETWANATKTGDVAELNQILGDDWVGLGPDGNSETKPSFLAGVKSGRLEINSFENGPMNVDVLGNIVVVQGSDIEKSTSDGQDTSGKYVWMDVFAKRDGKWVAVRSQIAQVK